MRIRMLARVVLGCLVMAAPVFGGQWMPYGHRYAIVVMGGPVTGQMYLWYWNDTSGKVWTLMDWGFAPEDIIFLTYGDSAYAHPELADLATFGRAYKDTVKAAFDSVASWVTQDDLVHVWWVDHGNSNGFQCFNGFVYFTELKQWIDNINCRAYIGAYNPCYSGAIMPHMQGLCNENRRVISATSVHASQPNSYGWAGQWRFAMRGGRPDSYVASYSDKNGDGYVALDESYEWETPHSNDAGEYPLFDDNGDGVGGDFTNPATYDSSGQDSTKDGFCGQFYSLMGWYDRGADRHGPDPWLARSSFSSSSNPWFDPVAPIVDVVVQWSVGAPLPSPVCDGASGLIGDKIYLFGGHPTPAAVHYEYDITGDTWSTVEPMPIPGSLTRGVVHGGNLYLFGGHTLGSDTMRCYDPVANSWQLLAAPYPGWRECCKYGAGAVGDTIYYYYMEERYSYAPVQIFWEYDIINDSWSENSAPSAPKRMYLASASDANYCYAIGGLSHEDLNPMREAIRYDPSSGSWETIDSLPEPVAYADGDFLNGRLFLAGGGAGYSSCPASDKVWVWEEGRGWLIGTPLPAPVGRPHVEVATIGGTDYIFVFGGYSDGYLNTLYIGEVMSIGIREPAQPGSVLSLSVTPNLIRSEATVNFSVDRSGELLLLLYDITGRSVKRLARGRYDAGDHRLHLDAKDLPSGTYFLELRTSGGRQRAKMIKIR